MSYIQTSGTLQREGDLLSKPSSQAWRPSTLRGAIPTSLVEFPAPSPASPSGFSLLGVLHLLLTLPPPICWTTSLYHRWDHRAKANKHISLSQPVPLCLSLATSLPSLGALGSNLAHPTIF